MNIEIFFFLIYRQLFTFALLKTTRPPRTLFLTIVTYTKFVLNFQFWEEFNKVLLYKKNIDIIIIIIIIIIDNDTGYIKTTNYVASKWIIMISSNER